jgi:hypothetical protein
MGDSPRGRCRSWLALLAACAAVVLVVSGCFDAGEPTSYDATVEENFTNGCVVAAESDAEIRPVARRYCACAWDRLKTGEEIGFDDFKKLDDDVRDDAARIAADDEESTGAALTAIFTGCRAEHGRN